MEANSSLVVSTPVQGDFAAGVRTKPGTRTARGDFATGMRSIGTAAARHHGDFASGLRSRLHRVTRPGDFAIGLRTGKSPAGA
jgi:hypothetical protein